MEPQVACDSIKLPSGDDPGVQTFDKQVEERAEESVEEKFFRAADAEVVAAACFGVKQPVLVVVVDRGPKKAANEKELTDRIQQLVRLGRGTFLSHYDKDCLAAVVSAEDAEKLAFIGVRSYKSAKRARDFMQDELPPWHYPVLRFDDNRYTLDLREAGMSI